MKKLSVITPACNEAENLPELRAELLPVLEALQLDWEWIILDDHSADATPQVIAGFAQDDARIRGLRTARNQGSHRLSLFGFQKACGDCAVILAADGQDAPGNIPQLLAKMGEGHNVVWLTRTRGRADPLLKRMMARLYYFTMRRIIGIDSIPPGGGDMVLADRAVLDALGGLSERNVNFLATVAELGFAQAYIAGERRPRRHGKSHFSFVKNFNLLWDTIIALSVTPLRMITLLGFATTFLGFLYSINVIVASFRGVPVEGWASLMLTVLIIGGVQMVMLGTIGEYLWRTLENTRRKVIDIERTMGGWNDE